MADRKTISEIRTYFLLPLNPPNCGVNGVIGIGEWILLELLELEVVDLDSPSTLYLVPASALSKHSNLPFSEANSDEPKSSVMNIDDAMSYKSKISEIK